ncbi:type IX secretion system membrane protein, PorP/SprF family [Catalinimonas alkaloidigena]|uniref:Type IX secretion system membrane protein, PorP/SprF family n=1 Tax=Catalinimonas alkaloidigena TaxID=1075417 RepID=A0A1G9GUY0_9BACT|nr:PorP/SprF family type IX secretion system membrane protein [Catalinimonas alkaloidigena]SDL04083.1 type IX secretion system membrane protein, PorP/SprF family [Catalinimonas alkaloidigena]
MRKYLLTFPIVLLMHWALRAQDMQFTQAYASPLQLNPALCGYFHPSHPFRLATVYRNQWPGVPARYETIYASADFSLQDRRRYYRGQGVRNFAKTVSPVGLGLVASSDRAGKAVNLRSSQLALQYALEIPLIVRRANSRAQGLYMRVGFQGGIVSRDLDYSKLVFADELSSPGAGEVIAGNSRLYADFAAGGLIYSRRFWLGGAVHHLTTPNTAAGYDGISPLPRRITFHTGWLIPLEGSTPGTRPRRSFSPVAMYRMQGQFDQLDLGGSIYVRPISLGVFYRGLPVKQPIQGVFNQDAVSILFGVEFESMGFGYSYDLTVSSLGTAGNGAHEISLIYRMPALNRPKKLRREFPCLQF